MRARHSSGPIPKSFGDARTEPFDERVRTLDELEQGGRAVGMLEVDRHVASTTQQDVGGRRGGCRTTHRLRTFHTDHFGAHVGKQHRGERTGSDAGELDDADAVERACHRVPAAQTRGADARRRGDVAADRAHDLRPQRFGQVVAHVGEHEQIGAGDQFRRALGAAERDERVVTTVEDERRDAHLAQLLGTIAARPDPSQLARRTLG